MTRFMVIETIKPGKLDSVYQRFHAKGRMLPDGLHFIDSWLSAKGDRVFQLMETDDADTFNQWIPNWSDLVSFELVELGEKPNSR